MKELSLAATLAAVIRASRSVAVRSMASLSTLAILCSLAMPAGAWAADGAAAHKPGGEVNIVMPDLTNDTANPGTGVKAEFLGGQSGHNLLLVGLVISALGLGFGLWIYKRLKNMQVHRSMLEISELIYETCKAYLLRQGKFLMILWAFVAAAMTAYFLLLVKVSPGEMAMILLFSLIGIGGSYGVAWFGIRVNTFANSRAAFNALRGKPFPCYDIPLKAGMSIGMALISVELLIMLVILLFLPSELAGKCFIGFAIGESLGAAALRIAGGIFTKIADIGSDLMKIVFKIKEDDARNPGVIADCVGDNAGDSVGPSADGFETYGVTGVALISFIMLAILPGLYLPPGTTAATASADQLAQAAAAASTVQVQLLVWIFVMRIIMVVASAAAYFFNHVLARGKYAQADHMNFEKPLTSLVFITSGLSIVLTFIASKLLIPDIAGDTTLWWKLSTIITCGTLAGAIIPELVKVFTSTESRHVREVVTSSEQGGASLNILSGFVAGNFSAYWLGMAILGLMGAAYFITGIPNDSNQTLGDLMVAPAVFAFGLVAFGFLGMGPVTIAVDSYGPVTDNAQSVFELSTIESIPGIREEIKRDFGFEPDFERGKEFLEENDGAGNTFKATAKPVLIGTAVVGATTMIFALIVGLTHGLEDQAAIAKMSLLHPPFLLGLISGGCLIYWFTGSSTQAVSTGAYRAVEFIKANIRLEGTTKASVEDSKRVVDICTRYAQAGMFNIFLGVFFSTLAFAFFDSFFFIGFLLSTALFGLFQAIFMANAGGAWDNAKKVVETELKKKGTDLHAATVVGDTVGDPFKDTSSVAMNPVIKFSTLFGLLAVELAISLKSGSTHTTLTTVLTVAFFLVSLFFVYRSFYGMQISTRANA
ncbi:MAG: putative K(+)-stimulated pyrophosphate-energized sodium pump [Phycisphaerales bacterium]|nr:putative K(+)-stimulated pyrophosphate-energized sodium pump [Phycisphaerales bacterium]